MGDSNLRLSPSNKSPAGRLEDWLYRTKCFDAIEYFEYNERKTLAEIVSRVLNQRIDGIDS